MSMPRLLLICVLYVSLHTMNALESQDSGFIEIMQSAIKSLTQILGALFFSQLFVNFCIGCAVSAFPLGFFLLFIAGEAPPEDRDETDEISADEKRHTIATESCAAPENGKASCAFISDGLPSERSRFGHADNMPAESFDPAIDRLNSEENDLVLRLTNAPSEESGQYGLSRHSPKGSDPLEESRKSTLPLHSTNPGASVACANYSPREELGRSTLAVDSSVDPLTLMFLYHGVDMYEAFPLEVRRQSSSTSPTDEHAQHLTTGKVITSKPPQISTGLLSNLTCPAILENKLGMAMACVLVSFTMYKILRR